MSVIVDKKCEEKNWFEAFGSAERKMPTVIRTLRDVSASSRLAVSSGCCGSSGTIALRHLSYRIGQALPVFVFAKIICSTSSFFRNLRQRAALKCAKEFSYFTDDALSLVLLFGAVGLVAIKTAVRAILVIVCIISSIFVHIFDLLIIKKHFHKCDKGFAHRRIIVDIASIFINSITIFCLLLSSITLTNPLFLLSTIVVLTFSIYTDVYAEKHQIPEM